MIHPTKVGQIVKFIPSKNNERCPDNTLFRVINFINNSIDSFVWIEPIGKNLWRIHPSIDRYANRFQVVPPKISYPKDFNGTRYHRSKPIPIQRDEDMRTSVSMAPGGNSLDTYTYGVNLCESLTPRQHTIATDSFTARLRETSSEDSRPSIREDILSWSRGLISDVSNRHIEIPRPNHAAEARRLESHQSPRYQRSATSRHPVSSDVQESRPSRSSIYPSVNRHRSSTSSFSNSYGSPDSYSIHDVWATMFGEVDTRRFFGDADSVER